MFNRRDTGVSKAIIKARKRQEKLQGLVNIVSDSKSLQRFTDFEARSRNISKRNQINRIKAGLQKMDKASLAKRRARLADLIRRDEAVYKREIDSRVETIDQRKERMAKRAYELRDRREAATQRKAQELYMKRFRLGCDELRGLEGQKQSRFIFEERQKQVEENRRLRLAEQQKEAGYAKMWAEEGRRKEARHQSDLARLKRLNDEQTTNLLSQIGEKEQQRRDERQRVRDEQEAILRQAAEDARVAEEKKRRDDALERRRQEQVARYNKLRQMAKDAAREAELDEGEKLNRINQRAIAKAERDAHEKKMRMKAEQAAYLDHIRRQKEAEAQYQRDLNQAIQEEVARGNAKQDAIWKRDQDRRDRLFAEVDRVRRNQVLTRENQQVMRAKERQREKEQMIALERENAKIAANDGKDARLRAKQIQADQLKIIAMKEQRRNLERAKAIHEREYIDRQNAILEAFIAKEKADPNVKKPWHGLTKSGWYT